MYNLRSLNCELTLQRQSIPDVVYHFALAEGFCLEEAYTEDVH